MKIAVTWLVIPLVVGSANFGGAQQPSPIDWHPDSYTHTYRNAISNRQPDACCHSAPPVWPAHFALTLSGRQFQPNYLPLPTFDYYGELS